MSPEYDVTPNVVEDAVTPIQSPAYQPQLALLLSTRSVAVPVPVAIVWLDALAAKSAKK